MYSVTERTLSQMVFQKFTKVFSNSYFSKQWAAASNFTRSCPAFLVQFLLKSTFMWNVLHVFHEKLSYDPEISNEINLANCVGWFFGPPFYRGFYKITVVCLPVCLSVCLSVCSSVHLSFQCFSQKCLNSFFWFFGTVVDDWNN